MVADVALRVDEVDGQASTGCRKPPDPEVVVDGDGIVDLQVGDRLLDVGDLLLERELGRCTPITTRPWSRYLGPGADIRERPQAVDAGVRPEVHQHDLAPQPLRRQRRRVQPFHRADQRRQLAFDRPRGSPAPAPSWRPTARHRATDDARSSAPDLAAPAPVQQPLLEAAVVVAEIRVRNPVSSPSAIAATPTRTAAPRPRRSHSPAPSDRFIAAKTRPPARSARASEVAAPAA